jgi:hypothetical protein
MDELNELKKSLLKESNGNQVLATKNNEGYREFHLIPLIGKICLLSGHTSDKLTNDELDMLNNIYLKEWTLIANLGNIKTDESYIVFDIIYITGLPEDGFLIHENQGLKLLLFNSKLSNKDKNKISSYKIL